MCPESGLAMNTMTPIKSVAAAGLAAVFFITPATDAQQRVGNDGRGLDASQQVGSAGYNRADGRLDFSQRNNIITGNVGGGRGFQDTIGYGAVGEFQDTLGSDELFGFRAQSLSSSPGYLNAVNIGGVGARRNFSVYRSFTNRAAQPQTPGLIAPDGGGFQLVPTQSLYSTPGGGYASPFIGTNTSGRALQAFSSSPLLGLRGQLSPTQAINRQLYEAARESHALSIPQGLIAPQAYDTDVFDPYSKPKDDKPDPDKTLTPGQLPATLIIGQQLQTLDEDPENDPDAKDTDRSSLMLDTLFRPLEKQEDDPTQADDGDPYLKLLRDIRDNKDDPAQENEDDKAGWENALEAPTKQQVTEAERAFDTIMVEMYGEGYQARRERRRAASESAEQDGQVQGVVEQLNYNLPRLKTLASNKQNRIARMTLEAEAAMADGKYLSAESRYRQIILDTDDDPLPRAGLINAQLGAGMFRSAGLNLRSLFAKHPELIAARYDARLLPPKDRLQWIQQELQTAISQGEGGKDAPILLAYLGYQASSRQVVRYGLALAQANSPRDPLLSVLREIWLDGEAVQVDGK
jgi:hypothetical protein